MYPELNILLDLEYIGSNYFGFQVQKKRAKAEPTIQGAVEEALGKLFRRKVRITASGRTDRGVHAISQPVNFKIKTGISPTNIKAALNRFLPVDIRVKRVRVVADNFHARFSAKSKIYRYVILQAKEPSVFTRSFCWCVPDKLNLTRMRKAAARLTGRKNFAFFAREAKRYPDCRRTIKRITITKKAEFVYIDIEADGFLRSMARNIVSFLSRASFGNIPSRDIPLIFQGKTSYVNKPAPASGLYLFKVKY
jgi:tRNA pseudouridine38-40 synthase